LQAGAVEVPTTTYTKVAKSVKTLARMLVDKTNDAASTNHLILQREFGTEAQFMKAVVDKEPTLVDQSLNALAQILLD